MLHHIQHIHLISQLKRSTLLFGMSVALLGSILAAPFVHAGSSAPIVYRGAQWYGGSGVNVCTNTNGGGTKDRCGNETFVGGVAGARWQCVEFVQRFYKKMGWHSGIFSGVWYAHDIYDVAAQNGFTRQANGNITDIQPGDMIVHHKNAPYTYGFGHVSIVDRISGSIVYAVEQNTGSPTAAYTLDGKTLNRQGLTMIRGIVKAKNNTSTPVTSSPATALAYATTKDGTPRIFSGTQDGRIYQTGWEWRNDTPRTTVELTRQSSPVTAIASSSTRGNYPQLIYGTQDGSIYRVQWINANRTIVKIASVGSPVNSLEYADGTGGRSFVYAGAENGHLYVAQWTGSANASVTQIANVQSPVTDLSFNPNNSNPRLYVGTRSGSIHEIQWTWNTLSYTSRLLTTVPSAVTSLAYRNATELYTATQGGSVYQTNINGTIVSEQIARYNLPVTALAYAPTDDQQPRLYSATSDGRIHQTHWGDMARGTIYFDAINGTPRDMIYAATNRGKPRLYSVSSNGGIYQTHWGDTKLGVLELARP